MVSLDMGEARVIDTDTHFSFIGLAEAWHSGGLVEQGHGGTVFMGSLTFSAPVTL